MSTECSTSIAAADAGWRMFELPRRVTSRTTESGKWWTQLDWAAIRREVNQGHAVCLSVALGDMEAVRGYASRHLGPGVRTRNHKQRDELWVCQRDATLDAKGLRFRAEGIAELMKTHGFEHLGWFARRVGICWKRIRGWLSGEVSPHVDEIGRMCVEFDVRPEFFVRKWGDFA